MDATVATGAAGIMAIRVLLDHDVPEENIMLVSLLMAEIGVHSIAYAFPKVSWTKFDFWVTTWNLHEILQTTIKYFCSALIEFILQQVQIVTSALDPEINDKFYVIPGIGNFGDRYFGTEPAEYDP